jgi:PAP2 superfamily
MEWRLSRVASLATLLASTFLALAVAAQDSGISSRQAFGPNVGVTAVTPPPLRNPLPGADLRSWIIHWNEVALNVSGLDHTPVMPGENRVFGEQFGPTRASRAMAIVHIAMFDSLIAISGGFRSYTGLTPVAGPVSAKAAVAQSMHDTLVGLFPSQRAALDAELADSMQRLTDSEQARNGGIALGQRAASLILNQRVNDGSQRAEPVYGQGYIPGNQPGRWRRDPISQVNIALGAFWGSVRPFALQSSQQFRIPPPPALNSPAYAAAFNEVKRLGGDGVTTPTQRTDDQTFAGLYWAYDGTPSLCAPSRLYNQILVTLALQRNSNAMQTARLLALANVAMADGAIASWESKFFYQFWRPITGIRESDPGTGPTGAGDGNAATTGDVNFMPLGAPASNLNGPNFTPPFPAYPSGHATFGGVLFQTLRNFYGSDNIPFTFVSDEFNGVTRDNQGNVRPLRPRSFASFTAAEEENGQSRIYLGIHWAFDKTEGITQGQQVADFVFDRVYVPL